MLKKSFLIFLPIFFITLALVSCGGGGGGGVSKATVSGEVQFPEGSVQTRVLQQATNQAKITFLDLFFKHEYTASLTYLEDRTEGDQKYKVYTYSIKVGRGRPYDVKALDENGRELETLLLVPVVKSRNDVDLDFKTTVCSLYVKYLKDTIWESISKISFSDVKDTLINLFSDIKDLIDKIEDLKREDHPLLFAIKDTLLEKVRAGTSYTLDKMKNVVDERLKDEFGVGIDDIKEVIEEGKKAAAFVVTTDYQTGGYATLQNLDDIENVKVTKGPSNQELVSPDPVCFHHEGKLYILNRYNYNNLTIVNASDKKLISQFSIKGDDAIQANPHDLVFCGNKAYITRYGGKKLWIVNPDATNEKDFKISEIDLSSFSDSDGVPEMDKAVLVGDKLFVTLQRLDRNNYFAPTEKSYVVVIDTTKDELIDTDPSTEEIDPISLKSTNPFDILYNPSSGKIVVVCVGSFFDATDGDIEVIDPETYKVESKLKESDLGINFSYFTMTSSSEGFIIGSDANWNTNLYKFNLDTKKSEKIYEETGYSLVFVKKFGDKIYVGDRNFSNPGVVVFGEDGKKLAGPIDCGLPPFDIAFYFE